MSLDRLARCYPAAPRHADGAGRAALPVLPAAGRGRLHLPPAPGRRLRGHRALAGAGLPRAGHPRPGLRPLPAPAPRADRDPAPGRDRRALLRAGGRGDRSTSRPTGSWRSTVVKLLCLLAASPVERPRSAAELADLLLTRLSALDPSANVAYLERAVLEPLVARGALRRGPSRAAPGLHGGTGGRRRRGGAGPPGAGARRAVARRPAGGPHARRAGVIADAAAAAAGRCRARPPGVPVAEHPAVSAGACPCGSPSSAERRHRRPRRPRPGRSGPRGACWWPSRRLEDGDLVARARALCCLERAGGDLGPAAPRGRGGRRRPASCTAAGSSWSRPGPRDGPRPGGLVEFLERSAAGDEARAREVLQQAYFSGAVARGSGRPRSTCRRWPGWRSSALLVSLADPLLVSLHPLHREVAPRGELVGERLLRQLVVDVLTQPRITAAAAERGQLRSAARPGTWCPSGSSAGGGMPTCCRPTRCAARRWPRCCASSRRRAPCPRPRWWPALADGPVGLTEPEALLVLNACVQAGLIEMRRGRRLVAGPVPGRYVRRPADGRRAARTRRRVPPSPGWGRSWARGRGSRGTPPAAGGLGAGAGVARRPARRRGPGPRTAWTRWPTTPCWPRW